MSRSPLYTVLAAAVLFLILVPLGTSVFILGFIHGDSPCILCWAQRIGMSLVALIGLFILRYGPKPKYVGLGILVGAWGLFMAIRHSSLHLMRDVGQGFAIQMLGAHTYVWSFAVFWVCIIVMAVMLMKVPPEDLQPAPFDAAQGRPPGMLRGVDPVRDDHVSRRDRRHDRAGVCEHRAAPVRRPVGSGALLVQPAVLGVVARGVLVRADLAPRPMGYRAAGRRDARSFPILRAR